MIIRTIHNCTSLSFEVVNNYLSNFFNKVTYLIEPADWVIQSMGEIITKEIIRLNLVQGRIAVTPLGIRNQVLHFGSEHTLSFQYHKSNHVIVSWFHFIPESSKNILIKNNINKIDYVHTSCLLTQRDLISFGIPKEKIIIIPIGVDLGLFKPSTASDKHTIRQKLGLPKNAFIVGSFQKESNYCN